MARAQMKTIPEHAFQDKVIALCRYLGLKVYHTYDSRKSDPGFPDLVIVGRSGVVFAELKSSKGKVSLAQADWLERLAKAGMSTYLWRPEDFDEVQRVLNSLSKWAGHE